MLRALIFLLLLTLIGNGLSGCLSTAEVPCWQIPLPKAGSTFELESKVLVDDVWHNNSAKASITEERFMRGDGQVERAIAMAWPNGERTYFSQNGTPLGRLFMFGEPLMLLSLDSGLTPLLSGRCLMQGDQVDVPYKDGLQHMTVDVLSHHPILKVEMRSPSGQGSVWNGFSNHTGFQLVEWQSKTDALPSRIEVYNTTSQRVEWIGGFTAFQGDTYHLGDAAPAEPFHLARPSRPVGCETLPERHPDLGPLPTHPRATFDAYLQNMSKDSALQEFLSKHPLSCASQVSYVTIAENSSKTSNYAPTPPKAIEKTSTALLWTTIFADPAGDHYMKRWVVRCYHDPALVAVYGDCTEHPYYRASDKLGPRQGTPVDVDLINTEIGLDKVLENVERLTASEIKHMVWQTQTPPVPPQLIYPALGDEAGPSYRFGFQALNYTIDYAGYRGVSPGGSRGTDAQIMIMWDSGLAAQVPVHLLRDP